MEVRQVQDLGEGRPRGRGRGDEGGGGVEGGAVQRPVGGAGGAGGAAGPQHHAADVAAGEGVLQHGAVTRADTGWALELQTKVHTKVCNHRNEGW